MITADHKYWARFVFNLYIDKQFKKHFNGFKIVNQLPLIEKDKSLIILPNHFSWWDGFLIDYINRKLINRKFYILMLEEQLNRYWFFQKLGAFSINQNNPKSIIETSLYFKQLLKFNNSLISFYIQGKIEPFGYENITIKNGIKIFIKGNEQNTQLLPISFKFQYYEDKKPDILCRFGNVLNATDKNIDKLIKREFLDNLKNLDLASINKNWIETI